MLSEYLRSDVVNGVWRGTGNRKCQLLPESVPGSDFFSRKWQLLPESVPLMQKVIFFQQEVAFRLFYVVLLSELGVKFSRTARSVHVLCMCMHTCMRTVETRYKEISYSEFLYII